MRIYSFLPSGTEILFALGLADSVMGVTFECDYPPEARTKPVVVYSKLPPNLPEREIDRHVKVSSQAGAAFTGWMRRNWSEFSRTLSSHKICATSARSPRTTCALCWDDYPRSRGCLPSAHEPLRTFGATSSLSARPLVERRRQPNSSRVLVLRFPGWRQDAREILHASCVWSGSTHPLLVATGCRRW